MLLVRKLKGAWRGQAFAWRGQFLGTVLSLQSEAVLWEAAEFKGHTPQPLPAGSRKRVPHQQYFSNSSATWGTFRHCFVLWLPVISL